MRKSNGFLIALAGFALLSCGDAVIKSMAGQWPATAIAALRFCIAIPLLGILVLEMASRRLWSAVRFCRPLEVFRLHLRRCCSFSACFSCRRPRRPHRLRQPDIDGHFIDGVSSRTDELCRMGKRRGALCGVALISGAPNPAEFGLIALLPLVAAFFFACMMIFNRMAAGTGTAVVLQFYLALAATPLLMLFAVTGHYSGIEALQVTTPDWSIIARCAIVAVSASLAHGLIYVGTTRANAAVAAQAVYIQLPVALAIDAFIFRHWPDLAAMIGVVLIISAGLVNGLIPLMRRK